MFPNGEEGMKMLKVKRKRKKEREREREREGERENTKMLTGAIKWHKVREYTVALTSMELSFSPV